MHLLFFGPNFWCTPTREAAICDSCVVVPSLRGVTWVRSDCFVLHFCCFSWIAFSCHGFSLSIFFVFRRFFAASFVWTSIPSSFGESRDSCDRPGLHGEFVAFESLRRPSAHFVARGRGKPRSQATVGAGLRIGPHFLLRRRIWLDPIFCTLFFPTFFFADSSCRRKHDTFRCSTDVWGPAKASRRAALQSTSPWSTASSKPP